MTSALISAITTPQHGVSEGSLSKLPAELIDIVAMNLGKPGLLSMRATCRDLRAGSTLEYIRRYTICKIALDGRDLHVVLESPDLTRAEALLKPLLASLPIGSTVRLISQRLRSKTSNDAKALDIPPENYRERLDDEVLDERKNLKKYVLPEHSSEDGVSAVSLVLNGLAALQINLTRLIVKNVRVSRGADTAAFTTVLSAHARSLLSVNFFSVDFDNSATACFRALLLSDVSSILLDDVRAHGEYRRTTWNWDAGFAFFRFWVDQVQELKDRVDWLAVMHMDGSYYFCR